MCLKMSQNKFRSYLGLKFSKKYSKLTMLHMIFPILHQTHLEYAFAMIVNFQTDEGIIQTMPTWI